MTLVKSEEGTALLLTVLWISQALCFISVVVYGIYAYPDRSLATNVVLIAAGCFAVTGVPLLAWLKRIRREIRRQR